MKKALKDLALQELAAQMGEEEGAPPDIIRIDAWEKWKKGWRPRLNPKQRQGMLSRCAFKLLHGPRASGKSVGALHELVEHAFLNPDALCVIAVKEVAMGTDGGAWQKLLLDVLPVWAHGNQEPLNIKVNGKWERNPNFGRPTDEGIGIAYKEGFDAQTHRPLIWIQNRFGGWSKVILISLPVSGQVQSKIKGKEPSFIFVDEAQTLEDSGYFTFLVQQLGRAARCLTEQIIVYACNPDAPEHWVYKKFFLDPVNEETGEWNPDYLTLQIPFEENIENVALTYYNKLIEATRNDPIEKARMIDGIWIAKPLGKAIFGGSVVEGHFIGDAAKNRGLSPVPNHPVIISYDLGAAHSSLHFIQIVPVLKRERPWKLILEELNFVGTYMKYSALVPILIKRMQYFEELNGGPLKWVHISDNSAFNQYRAKDGSYDCWDVENISKSYVEKHKLDPRFIIKMIECPKGPGSIEARVRLLIDYLEDDEIRLSATCVKTREMMMNLVADDRHAYKPKESSPLVHPFDSLTYGLLYFDKGRIRNPVNETPVKPQTYHFGA